MILYEVTKTCIRAEVPATATRQDIERFERELKMFEPAAKSLPLNYVMVNKINQLMKNHFNIF